jgi:hypothetical protein
MVLVAKLLFVVWVTYGGVAASTTGSKQTVSLSTKIRRSSHQSFLNERTTTSVSVARIPRGGGGGVSGGVITKNRLAAACVAVSAVIGAIGVPAPEVVTIWWYSGFRIREGGLDHFWAESLYSTIGGIAITTYLSVFKHYSAVQAVLWGGLPCTYVTWKHFLKKSYSRFGFRKGFGLVQTVYMLTCVYLMVQGNWNPRTAAKMFCLPCVVSSGIVVLNTAVSANKLYGISKPTGLSYALFHWYHVSQMVFGVTCLALLTGKSTFAATGYGAAIGAAALWDSMFLRRDTHGSVRREVGLVFATALTLIAVGLLLDY